jgi:3-deoxy-D-manno-octulosonic-acid transferase
LQNIITFARINHFARIVVRILYTILFYLLLPFVFLRLIWRSRHLPGYRYRLKERLGFYPFTLKQSIWVHAVSVGETIAAIPLIKLLKTHYPHLPILITTMTPTGAERVKAAFGDEVYHAYLAYDLPLAVKRFLNAMHPVMAIFMETELWPNLLAECHHRNIPMCLLNARMSAKSAHGYRKTNGLIRGMLQRMSVIAANSANDAERFIQLGADRNKVHVTGNIKFDLELSVDLLTKSRELRMALGQERFIWIAASTHDGEEAIILAAQQKLVEVQKNALLILVPRHPDRFDAVAKNAEQLFKIQRRTQTKTCQPDTAVYLGDTMGELLLMYGAADAAFVGGSLIERGGHNILEPAALSKAILTGPHVFNFAEINQLFLDNQALIRVHDSDSLGEELIKLAKNLAQRENLGKRASEVMAANRGSLMRQLRLVQGFLH